MKKRLATPAAVVIVIVIVVIITIATVGMWHKMQGGMTVKTVGRVLRYSLKKGDTLRLTQKKGSVFWLFFESEEKQKDVAVIAGSTPMPCYYVIVMHSNERLQAAQHLPFVVGYEGNIVITAGVVPVDFGVEHLPSGSTRSRYRLIFIPRLL